MKTAHLQRHIHSKVKTHFRNNVLWWNIGGLREGSLVSTVHEEWVSVHTAEETQEAFRSQQINCLDVFVHSASFLTCTSSLVRVNAALFVSRYKTNCAMTFVQQLQYLLSHPGKMLDGKFNVFLMFSFDHRDILPHAKACHSTTGK